MAKMFVVGAPTTGTFTLSGAVSGFQTFAAAGVADGTLVSYSATDTYGWEVGRGTYHAAGPTLTRGPLFSSAGGGAVSFGLGTQVWIPILAEDIPAAGGLTQVPIDTRTAPQTYTLPSTAPANSQLVVFDLYGNALTNPITILGSGVTTPVINMNFGSVPFFWTGSLWFPF